MARVLAWLLAWLVLPASAEPRVSIALLPEAQVAGPSIHLGQIARMRSPELDLLRRLVNLDLGRAPGAGESASISARHLAAWMERRLGVRSDDVDWSGAPESRIERQAARLSGEEIARVAQAAFQDLHHGTSVAEEVFVSSVPRDLQVPRGPVRLHPRAADSAHGGTRTLVWVDVWVADAFVRSVPVSLRVPNAGPWRAAPGRHLAAPGGMAASPLLSDPGIRRPAVERGETAALRTIVGAVQVESRVQVLEDGRVGDLVRVRQQGATVLLSARVTGPGQVEVAR